MAHESRRDDALQVLADLHAEADREAAALAARHGARLVCRRGCAACCVDGLRVFDVEAERIRREAAPLLARGTPHAPGACAFLDADGACRIYAARPYVCRTQGLPLRWIAPGPRGEPVELRDVCPLNLADGGTPLERLEPGDCFALGPFEGRLAALQRAFSGGGLRRVSLRGLFGSRAAEGADSGAADQARGETCSAQEPSSQAGARPNQR